VLADGSATIDTSDSPERPSPCHVAPSISVFHIRTVHSNGMSRKDLEVTVQSFLPLPSQFPSSSCAASPLLSSYDKATATGQSDSDTHWKSRVSRG
jgi:hypothetical protein